MRWTWMMVVTLAIGCDDGGGGAAREVELVDGAVEADMAPTPQPDAAPDAQTPDAQAPDAAPVLVEDPEADLYENDPVTDEGQLSRIKVRTPTSDNGALTSEWVKVFNCLNEPGGVSAMPDFGGLRITVFLCHELQTVRPGPDGHYTHIAPPEDDADPNDQFAELMMYHHVNEAHDFFKETYGYEELDSPMPALVNVQLRTEPQLPLPGLMPGPDGWVPLDNAAFFPRESWEAFASQFGLPPRDSDQIIFFQGRTKDFSYDASVVRHEYSHAVVGTSRLQAAAVPDQYGLNNEPPSMNEGIADYFAASSLDLPAIGPYVGISRDLSRRRVCPDNTVDEIHANGEVFGATLWAIRSALGAEVADQVVFGALENFGLATTFQQAGELLIAEAAAIDADAARQVEEITRDFGLIDCVRAQQWRAFAAATTGIPNLVEGTQSVGGPGFREGVPGYKQFWIEAPEAAEGIELDVTLSAGGFFGPGGAPANGLNFAFRRDEAVFVDYVGGVHFTDDERLTPALDGSRQTFTIPTACIGAAGARAYLLPLNPGPNQLQILTMNKTDVDSLEGATNVVDCEPVGGGEADAGVDVGADAGADDAAVDPADAGAIDVDAG